MPILFFDTCALKHRYVSTNHSRVVRRAISDRRNECHISELTVLEIGSALGSHCRGAGLGLDDFDRFDRRFFKDVAAGLLRVRSIARRDLRRARHLLRFAGVVRARNITSGDALIAITGLELALERNERVTFWTADRRLHAVVASLDAFTKVLNFRFLAPP